MADLATLGLAVDSSQVKNATSALQDFSKAGKQAQQSADGVSDSLSKAKGPSADFVKNFAAADAQQGNYSKSANKVVDSLANQFARLNSTGKQWAQLSAIQKAGVDVNSDAANKIAGMAGALYDLEQQQKQVKAANDNTSSSFDRLANTLTRRVVFAFLVSQIRDLASYLVSLNAAIAATADTANRVGVSGSQYQGLQTAAAYKGVGNDAFNSAMLGFNQQIDLAKHGLGDLQTLLRSNGKTVSDTATTFGIIADLVKNAGSEAQKFSILQQAGLPATREFAKLMEQGKTSIQQQADASTKLTQQQLEEAKKIDEEWQRMWTNFERYGKAAVVNVYTSLRDAIKNGSLGAVAFEGMGPSQGDVNMAAAANKLRAGQGSKLTSGSDVSSLYNGLGFPTSVTGAGGTPKTFDPALAKQQIALEQQRLGLLSPLATAEDVVKAKQLEINAAALNNVGISKQQADALKLVALAQFEMSKVNQQAQIGVFDLATAQKAANDNLQSLVAQHLLDPNNPAQWAAAVTAAAKSTEQLAQQAKVAGAPLEQLQRLANTAGDLRGQLDTTAVTSLNAISSSLVDMTSGAKSAGDAFKDMSNNIIRAIEQMIIQMTIIKPIATALQSVLGGFAGGIFGGGSVSGYGTGSSATAAVAGHATGGLISGPGTGTSDSILARLSAGEFVVKASAASQHLPLLHAINDNVPVSRFASGGSVGNVVRPNFGAPNVIINNQTSTPIQQSGVQQNANGDFEVTLTNAVTGVLTADAAKNGPISKAFAARQAGFGGR